MSGGNNTVKLVNEHFLKITPVVVFLYLVKRRIDTYAIKVSCEIDHDKGLFLAVHNELKLQ